MNYTADFNLYRVTQGFNVPLAEDASKFIQLYANDIIICDGDGNVWVRDPKTGDPYHKAIFNATFVFANNVIFNHIGN